MNHSSRDPVSALSGFCLLACAVLLAFGWGWSMFQIRSGDPAQPSVLVSSAVALPQPKLERAEGIRPEATESQDAELAQVIANSLMLPDTSMVPKYLPVTNYPHVAHQAIIRPRGESGSVVPVALTHDRTPATTESAPRARMAIIIDDMGLARHNSVRMTEMPAPITLSYMSYAPDVQVQVDDARAKGHEIMLHLPMEPLDRALYPGPGALTTRLSPEQFRGNLAAALDSFKGYTGVNNHMGSRMTADPQAMATVMDELDRRNKFFVDSWTSPRSVAYQVAAAEGLPRARRDVFLDHYEGQDAVWNALAQAERMARRNGNVIVIGHPKDATVAVLRAWIPAAIKRGVEIVPVSRLLYHGPERRDPVLLADSARGAHQAAAIAPAAGRTAN